MLCMPRVFLISDSHFSDYARPDGIIVKFHRKFSNSAEMNACMIRNWNLVVNKDDKFFSIVDFAWLKDEMIKYASHLNGVKYFILGNHDFEGESVVAERREL